jgi:hypothetical protein
MIKAIIQKIKQKAIEDDNAYWLRQEEWIQRKDVQTSWGENMLFFSIGLLTMAIFKLFI